MTSMARTAALIVAAGSGTRAGGDRPKQYQSIAGRAVLAHAIDALASHAAIDLVQVVIGEGQELLYRDAVGDRDLPPPVIGGALRRQSVSAGLAALPADIGRVLIHDAARPFTPPAVIDRLLAALAETQGVVPVLPVADTLARRDQMLGETVPRDLLVRVQTPQAFDLVAIRAAHAGWNPAREATDDAQMLRETGASVAMVEGSPLLEKITVADDVITAAARFSASRTAMGFDVHGFTEGDHVMLGGVRIAHERALAGHSDADVALHAITDALLGTIAAGDIGSHFPPSDPQWRGAASDRFLIHARDLVTAAGGVIDHVDVTIICEAPKVGPHRDAIRRNIAALLRLAEGRVSVKATTTERLGFTGRGEGIAAQAVATVRVPEVR